MMRWRSLLVLLAAMAAGRCVPPAPRLGMPGYILSESSVLLHDHALRLHLSSPLPPAAGPLLVYATGDVGWWWKDREIFDRLVTFGYPAVGFSSREYLRHLGPGVDVVRTGQVARDYAAVIRAAESALGLGSATPIVLVGKSRGAGLAVAAAGQLRRRELLDGLVAVGLTREEEYVRSRLWKRPRTEDMLDTYAALAAIGAVPVAVIQSTNDDYVTAAEARTLLGGDTSLRQLRAVESHDHNFGGARDVMYRELERELHWIIER